MPLVVRPRMGAFVNSSNRFGLDYRAEAAAFPKLVYPIIDVHTHINGVRSAPLMKEAMDLYGVGAAYSMSAIEHVPALKEIFVDRIRFIAIPDWGSKDRRHANSVGFLERIQKFYDLGARIVKFWQAPRLMEMAAEHGDPHLWALESSARQDAMRLADSLGMTFMTHVADPNTWFVSRYKDVNKYGTKASHYEPLERLLDRFRHRTWIAAHMGGWPEDLEFLSGLLDRHRNLNLDSSATKWVVREVSKHSPDEVVDFLRRFQGRILFGSDIVTADEHLRSGEGKTEMQAKADTAEGAFDLYASRYWALRMLWEGSGSMESPIADPDLAMVDPTKHQPNDAPTLRGMNVPPDVLRWLYRDAAIKVLG